MLFETLLLMTGVQHRIHALLHIQLPARVSDLVMGAIDVLAWMLSPTCLLDLWNVQIFAIFSGLLFEAMLPVSLILHVEARLRLLLLPTFILLVNISQRTAHLRLPTRCLAAIVVICIFALVCRACLPARLDAGLGIEHLAFQWVIQLLIPTLGGLVAFQCQAMVLDP